MQWLLGLALALGVSYAALRLGSLTRGGAVTATCLGTVVFGIGGWQGAAVLLAFFLTSSLLSQRTKGAGGPGSDHYAKGSRRDSGQVLGNGAVACLCLISHVALPELNWPWLGFAGAVAAANADTWATELGALSRSRPRLITQPRRVVAPGTSGGVSALGTLMAVIGAAAIAALSGALLSQVSWQAAMAIAIGGVAGSLVDSLLGATVQCLYWCPGEKLETEQHPLHRCGAASVYLRGWRWLDNDWVNAACAAFGSLVSIAAGFAFGLAG
jgi:uncharacterized protein (TIGR00297 family)